MTSERTSSGRDGREGLSIGAVLKALQPEFPDLSISKIRFLEGKGLITPTRSGSGYRYFTAVDVERLDFILRAQRDRFWPLKVIREALDAMDRGLLPPEAGQSAPRATAPVATRDPEVPDAAALSDLSHPLRLTAMELREASGLDETQLAALVGYGLVQPDAEGHFDENDLAVASEAGTLAAYGIEARHLRPFRMAADRELGLVAQALSPMTGRGSSASAAAQQARADIASRCIGLHVALVRAGLRDLR